MSLESDKKGHVMQGFAPSKIVQVQADTPYDVSEFDAFRPATAVNYIHGTGTFPFLLQACVVTVCSNMDTVEFDAVTVIELM